MRRAALVLTLAIPTSAVIAPMAEATTKAPTPAMFQKCDIFRQTYPHGVGRAGAKDHVKNPKVDKPVTNFTVNTAMYNKAMSYNKGLDLDHDGIACEKH